MRRAIQRSLQKYKHIVDGSGTGLNLSTGVFASNIIVGLDNPLVSNTINVQARARVKAIYMEISFAVATASTRDDLHWCLQYNPQGALPAIDPTVTGSSTAKNYVIKSGVIHHFQANIPTKVYGLIRIPPKYQRYMNTDTLQFNVKSQFGAASESYTFKMIYKEIRG